MIMHFRLGHIKPYRYNIEKPGSLIISCMEQQLIAARFQCLQQFTAPARIQRHARQNLAAAPQIHPHAGRTAALRSVQHMRRQPAQWVNSTSE